MTGRAARWSSSIRARGGSPARRRRGTEAGAVRKGDLPQKTCAACGRPFAWRRKWARDWDAVKFCSDACRTGRREAARARQGATGKPRRGA
ncbi:DUF2256 domain-containing protein [Acidiphilium sp.]|uniref:DUF2256 domain-containing protein n=1 Tax=Acidiphilium sp. TaxID=527 RepID=UPI00338F91E2